MSLRGQEVTAFVPSVSSETLQLPQEQVSRATLAATDANQLLSTQRQHRDNHLLNPLMSESTHQVFGGAQPLEPVQGQEVSGVLVCELGGLLQTPLLVQDGFIPDG
ncbi:hypothetical protein INR49_004974 [Caranx melampygus]|nr:hypothetical protein INR49_004974 [Caranx melampygus]